MTPAARPLALIVALGLGLGGALVGAAPASAATFSVTKDADDGLAGSLTYAIANLVPGGNTITIDTAGPITIPGAIPVISEDVDIVSPGGAVTITTNDTLGHFAIDTATVTMSDLVIQPTVGGIGEGIEITTSAVTLTRVNVTGFQTGITALDSTLTVTEASITGNTLLGIAFADSVGTNAASLTDVSLGGASGAAVDTGALLFGSGGPLSLNRVTVDYADTAGLVIGSDVGDVVLQAVTVANSGIGINLGATGQAAVTASNVIVVDSLEGIVVNGLDDAELDLVDSSVLNSAGVGIDLTAANGSRATITSLTVSGSADSGIILDATDSTIGLSSSTSSGNGLGGACGCGGGSGVEIYADTSIVLLDHVTTTGNTAVFGGGIEIASATGGSTVGLVSATVTGNTATDDGGGIDIAGVADDGTTVRIRDSTVSGNTSADQGGGISFDGTGVATASTATVLIQRTTVDLNTASGYGAGIGVLDPTENSGGVPSILIDSSTLSHNTTPAGGGGLYVGKVSGGPASVSVQGSTLSGNAAQAGGGIYVETAGGGGPTLLSTIVGSSTIIDNTANTSGGIELNPGDHELLLDDSIVAENGGTFDLQLGAPATVAYSLIQNPASGIVLPATNLVGVAPQLGALADNGGRTLTHLISPSSPAYNAGNPATVGTGLDQRGLARVYEIIDMGSVEWNPPPPPPTPDPVLEIAATGSTTEPEPLLVGLLLLLAGTAMVAFSRLRLARSLG